MKKRSALCAFALSALAGASAFAGAEVMQVHLKFDFPGTIANNKDINFGKLTIAPKDVFIIDAKGKVKVSGSGRFLGGQYNPGQILVRSNGAQFISIQPFNYVSKHGITPKEATCALDSGPEAPCQTFRQSSVSVNGSILKVGIQAVAEHDVDRDQIHPTFDLAVIYQ